MRHCSTCRVSAECNRFRCSKPADAAGVTVTLFVFCQLTSESDQEGLVDLYYALRELEASKIMRTID
jgi:hypothetical protein